MKNTKLILFLFFMGMSMVCNGQSYFYSIGTTKGMTEIPVTEIPVDAADTTVVEFPEVVTASNKCIVSFPLEDLKLTSPFGIRRDPINRKSRMHSGIDLKAKFERVMAMLPGTVVKCGYSKTAGYFVTLSHGICTCSYLHLSRISVKQGDHVSAGETVGVSGSSGRSTGPHLHISCRWNDNKGKYFNPILLLSFVASKIL